MSEDKKRMAAAQDGAKNKQRSSEGRQGRARPQRRTKRGEETCALEGGAKLPGAGVAPLSLAVGLRSKTRGLLLTKPHDETLLLVPCSDVHTVGMRQHLDIAFVDHTGRILEVHRNVGPLRRLRNRNAVAVVERFSSCASPWFSEGDRVGVVPVEEEDL